MSALDIKSLIYEQKEIFAPDLATLRSGKKFSFKAKNFFNTDCLF